MTRDTDSNSQSEVSRLEAENARLASELAAVYDSLGWKCMLAYRRWRASGFGRRIQGLWEPVLSRLLKRVARTAWAGAVTPAVSERAPEHRPLSYEEWIAETEPSPALLGFQRRMSRHFRYRPTITIVVPVYRVSADVLRATLDSVCRQSYPNWELCIAHADPEASEMAAILADLSARDPRVRVEPMKNLGISANSNRALAMGSGEFTGFLDHDDSLAPSALFETVRLLNDRPDLDFIYSDKDQLTYPEGKRVLPLFKPRWSPEVLLGANYLTHFVVIRSALIRSVGGLSPATDGAQDWDLFFRVLEGTDRIEHIPQVLYHWRRVPTSVAGGGYDTKPYALEAERVTLRSQLERTIGGGDVTVRNLGLAQVRWPSQPGQRVSVVMLAGHGDGAAAVEALRSKAGSRDLEVLVCSLGQGAEPGAGGLVNPAELARSVNRIARGAAGGVLVFLDEHVRLRDADLIPELIGPLANPNIGVVGAKLLDADLSRIYQAGLAFDRTGRLCRPWRDMPDHADGYIGPADWYRNWLAVGGACFAVRAADFEQLHGFSATPSYPRLDVDLCLRQSLDFGRRVVCNPFAAAYQSQPALLERWTSPSGEETGAAYIQRSFPTGDPCISPHVECGPGGFHLVGPRGAEVRGSFEEESRAYVAALDASTALIQASVSANRPRSAGGLRTLTWFLPGFEHVYYGGIHTVFRFAEYFRLAHGVQSTFALVGAENCRQTRARIAEAYPELAANCQLLSIADLDGVGLVPPSDAAIATLWNTAYFLLRYAGTGNKLYLVQDYEPLFYPAGSTSALAEATYRFGFRGLCNTLPLADQYRAAGGQAEFFVPCVDGRVFFPPPGGRPPSPDLHTLFWYARPAHPRNGFELLASAMRRVKADLGHRVQIVAAGARWNPADYGLKDVVENLGVLGYSSTGALYRSCTAGVVLMATRHPSYLPLELMASGALVITNRNPHTEWLLQDGVNCLLADPCTPALFAERIEAGLENAHLRATITGQALQRVVAEFSDWDSQAERAYQYMAT